MKRFIAMDTFWYSIIAESDEVKDLEKAIHNYWDNNAWDTPYEKWRKKIYVYKKTKG